jgi:transcriptional regulator with XRE-family HTH domain
MGSVIDRAFGDHIRSLRHARGFTQEVLAQRSGLSTDSIRRMEAGVFSPSLQTLRKLAVGLDLNLSTLFGAFEMGEIQREHEILDLLATRSPTELDRALRVLIAFFDAIDERADDDPADELDDEALDDEAPDDEPDDGEPE